MPTADFQAKFHSLRFASCAGVALSLLSCGPASAEFNYGWPESYSGTGYSGDVVTPRLVRRAPAPRRDRKAEKIAAEGAKPQGPLLIAISIQKQQMKIFDSNGLFTQSPISSGTSSHPTPMGVFSVIEKQKFHRSNIYSGAPMPFMQRITWSGVAMHAGVLPGYPASHGCIRLPMGFAMKLWNYTRMGARVVVTPGEVSPSDIVHPTLALLQPAVPVAANPAEPAKPMLAIKTADASGALPGAVRADVPLAPAGPADVVNEKDDGAPPAPVNAAENDLPPMNAVAAGEPAVADPLPSHTAAVLDPAKNDIATDAAKTQTRVDAAPEAAPAPLKRTGPVAIFVSRKDGKIYVRHNFKPLFDMPIAIAPGDRPLGTHVFTARRAAEGDGELSWSAVSLPSRTRQASLANGEGSHRRQRSDAVALVSAIDGSAAEALNRITIPAGFMGQLGGALPPGSSLVVSDQALNAGETGAGTDFIVRLR